MSPCHFLGFPEHHGGCTGTESVHMFCCAPAPHKMRPSLCWNRTPHLFDRFYTPDNIQAFQGTFPHQSSEGHHRRMFACYLQVSTTRLFFSCVHAPTAAAFNCVISLKTGESGLRKLPGRCHTPALPKTSPLRACWDPALPQALSDPCEGRGGGAAHPLALRDGGPGDETVFQACSIPKMN